MAKNPKIALPLNDKVHTKPQWQMELEPRNKGNTLIPLSAESVIFDSTAYYLLSTNMHQRLKVLACCLHAQPVGW